MLVATTPQEALAKGLPKPSECDIVVAVFWSRIGTPLPPNFTKPDGNPYDSATEWELLDALTEAERSGKPEILIYRRSEVPLVALEDIERTDQLEQWRRLQGFFAGFRGPVGAVTRDFSLYETPSEFAQVLENDLRRRIYRLLESLKSEVVAIPSPGIPERPLWSGSPYPGLRSFTPEEAPIFFGRGREIDALLHHFSNRNSRFISVVGASGSGKSSLVAAGLLPRLQAGALEGSENWIWVRFTPAEISDDPFLALAVKLAPLLERPNLRAPDLAARFRATPETLEEVSTLILQRRPAKAELLLFIDQFEELFTLANPDCRDAFIALIATAAQSHRVRTVTTVRADFYGRCVEHVSLAHLLRHGTYPLGPPGARELYEIITGPAAVVGLSFEKELPERIVDDTAQAPGALPLLAFMLAELYNARDQANRVTTGAYFALGGSQGAIVSRAEEAFSSLDPAVKKAFPDVFTQLVRIDEDGVVVRRRASRQQIAISAAAATLVDTLTSVRLLVADQAENGEPIIEVAHEALLRNWPRLVNWIETVREDFHLLRQIRWATDEWVHSGRNKAYLWSIERLRIQSDAIKRVRPNLSEVELSFVEWEPDQVLPNLLKVFICHASEDKPRIRDLYDRLDHDGFSPWLDEKDIVPGKDWRLEIESAVQQSDVILVCLSKTSTTKSGYVQKEIKSALDVADEQPEGTIFLIPARLEECIVPARLSHLQWVNLFERAGYANLLKALRLRASDVRARSC
jgi:hypothetical protein